MPREGWASSPGATSAGSRGAQRLVGLVDDMQRVEGARIADVRQGLECDLAQETGVVAQRDVRLHLRHLSQDGSNGANEGLNVSKRCSNRSGDDVACFRVRIGYR